MVEIIILIIVASAILITLTRFCYVAWLHSSKKEDEVKYEPMQEKYLKYSITELTPEIESLAREIFINRVKIIHSDVEELMSSQEYAKKTNSRIFLDIATSAYAAAFEFYNLKENSRDDNDL